MRAIRFSGLIRKRLAYVGASGMASYFKVSHCLAEGQPKTL